MPIQTQHNLKVSVLIPYKDAAQTLPACLKSFARQTVTSNSFDIIVVDDGSQKVPAASILNQLSLPMPVKLIELKKHCGQAAATNRAIEAAQGELLIFTCADIIAAPNFIEEHLQSHEDASGPVGVMGYISYHESVNMNFFMQYLWESDIQFSFHNISDSNDVDPKLLYAPNFSAMKSHVEAVRGFDEQFVFGWQDTDFGIRLGALGLRMIFNKNALGHHLHPNTFERFLTRERMAGELMVPMLEKYPMAVLNLESSVVRENVFKAMCLMPRVDDFIDSCQKLEKLLETNKLVSPELVQNSRQKLFNLYTLTFMLVRFQAALKHRERLFKILKISEEEISDYLKQAA